MRKIAAAGVLALMLAGCSSSDEPAPEASPSTSASASASASPSGGATPGAVALEVDPERKGMPEAEGDVEKLVADVAAAAGAGSCEQLAPLLLSEVRPTAVEVDAGEPARPEECPALAPYLATLKGISYTKTTPYGPTALAWGQSSDNRSATLLLVEDTDGIRRVAAVFGGTSEHRDVAGGSGEARRTVGSFLEALRTGDCAGLARNAVQDPGSGLYRGTIDDTRMCAEQEQRRAAELVKEDEPTKLHVLAETSFGALYGVPVGETYLVFHVTQQPDPVVAAEPDRVYGVQDHYSVVVG